MATAWKHPQLGTFTRNEFKYWESIVKARGFDAFAYTSKLKNNGPAKGMYRVMFDDRGARRPAPALVAVAEKVLADPPALARILAQGLWDTICGKGPESGTWWHGEPKKVNASVAGAWFAKKKLPKLRRAEDLYSVLRLMGIDIVPTAPSAGTMVGLFPRKGLGPRFRQRHPVVAHFAFAAAFEEEHGLALLTDGQKLLGTGYIGEVEVFCI